MFYGKWIVELTTERHCVSFAILGRPPQSQRDRARKGKKSKKRGNSRRGRGKKCRKQRYRDYYIEPNGCRSKKSFKMVRKLQIYKDKSFTRIRNENN